MESNLNENDEIDSFVVVGDEDLVDYEPNNVVKENKRFHHNKLVLSELNPGDLIEFKRKLYSHWAVYIGNSKIIHFSGVNSNNGISISGVNLTEINNAKVIIDSYWEITQDSLAFRNNLFDKVLNPLPVESIMTRAFAKVGESNFCLFSNNCEHFAKYCRYGINSSDQILKFIRFGNTVTKSLRDIKTKCTDLVVNN